MINEITISNETFYDKDYNETFRYQDKYVFFSINDSTSTLVSIYKDFLDKAIGDKASGQFQDYALCQKDIGAIKSLFEQQLDEILPKRKISGKLPHKRIEYKNKFYELDLRLTNPIDRQIDDYYKIIIIAEECLAENKPMYLSME